MKIYSIRTTVIMCFILIGYNGLSQVKKDAFDNIRFIQSEYGKDIVYVKWFSVGKNPARQFYPFRYENEKPVPVKSINMVYTRQDTTFFVVQDTIKPSINEHGLLQYFITPYDTAGKPGNSSEIGLVTSAVGRWFTKTDAEVLNKEKGIKITWVIEDNKLFKYIELYRSTDYYKNYELLATVAPEISEYTDRKIKPDQVYYYLLKAMPVDGNKPVVSNIIFNAGINPMPPLPPYIKLVKALRNGAVLHIQVTDSEAGGVRVFRDDGKSPDLFVVSDLLRVPDSLVVVYYDTASRLSGRTTYTYGAKTESTSFIESPLSNKVYVRPLISTPPAAPLDFTAYEEEGTVRLFWENLAETDKGIAGYILQRRDESIKGTSFNDLNPDGRLYQLNYYTDSTVQPGKSYTYQVISVDVDDNLSKTGSVTGIVMHSNIPAEPFALRGYRSDEGNYLQWSQTIYEGIASVNLYRYQKGSKPELVVKLPADATEYTDAKAQEGKLYYYFVTTVNNTGLESKPSEEVTVQ